MEKLKGFNISGTLVPFTSEDTYATHDEQYGRGGYRTVASIQERDAIPQERRKEGMLVNVAGGSMYQLKNGAFVKVDFGSGGGGSSTPNLDIDIKIELKADGVHAVFFRIKEKHENGYIFFLRKKKQTYQAASGRKKIVKYVPQNLSYGVIPGISVGNLQTDVWYECPLVNRDDLIGRYLKGTTFPNSTSSHTNIVRFKGNVHANPSRYTTTTAAPNKITSVLHMGLQYNIINPNYKNKIRENGKMPKPFLQTGQIERFVGRLRAGNTFNNSPVLYLSVE
jgi:hypothetical protein